MTRAERIQRIIWLGRLAAAAAAEAKTERVALEADAGAEYVGQGVAPTYRMPDIATVSSRIARDTVDVIDPAALLDWVTKRHPTEVEPTIRPAFVDRLRKTVRPDGTNVVDAAGERIPGLRYRAGGRFIGVTVKVDDAAGEVFDALAVEALAAAELTVSPAVTGQLAELVGGETPGHLDPSEVGEP